MNSYSVAVAVSLFGLLLAQDPQGSDIQNPLKPDGSQGTATAIDDASEFDSDIVAALNELSCISTHELFFGGGTGQLADSSAENISGSRHSGRYWAYDMPEPGEEGKTDMLDDPDALAGTLPDDPDGSFDPERCNHILIDDANIVTVPRTPC